MLATIFLVLILSAPLLASDFPAEEILPSSEQRVATNFSAISESDKIFATEALQAIHVHKLQTEIAAVHECRERFIIYLEEMIIFFNVQLRAELQKIESWFVVERDKKLATIQKQLENLNDREKQVRHPFELFLAGNPKANRKSEEFDLQFYIAPITRERNALIAVTCGDISREHNARKLDIYSKFALCLEVLKNRLDSI